MGIEGSGGNSQKQWTPTVLATDRSILQSIDMRFKFLLCKMQEQIPFSPSLVQDEHTYELKNCLLFRVAYYVKILKFSLLYVIILKRRVLMNNYLEKIKFVKEKVSSYLLEIFKVYGNELILRLEDYNLLQNKYNCIESSTAIGFIMEEFIVSKLETYTKNHNNIDEIKIERMLNRGTQTTSYDCFANYKNVCFMINIKVEKKTNNAISAIKLLHNDYSVNNPDQEKAFIVLKTKYTYGESQKSKERKIIINGISVFALEEVDFSNGHRQDHRNWSTEFKSESGRLQISRNFLESNKIQEEEISYIKTKNFIDMIYNESKSKNKN